MAVGAEKQVEEAEPAVQSGGMCRKSCSSFFQQCMGISFASCSHLHLCHIAR